MSSVRRNQIPAVTPKKRCAVYTRKSTDEGLDQEYNSLEAQRDEKWPQKSEQRDKWKLRA